MLGAPYPDVYWSYPPHLVLFVWPFGLMPYLPAYIAWCAIGIALYLFACSSVIPRERLLFLAVAARLLWRLAQSEGREIRPLPGQTVPSPA